MGLMAERTEELCLNGREWESALRPMAAGDPTIASGALTVSDIPNAHCRQFLADELRLAALWPQGRDFTPLAEWCVIVFAGVDEIQSVADVLERVRPLDNQTVVVLVLACGPEGDGWDGQVCHRGRQRPLAGFRVAGPGLPSFRRSDNEEAVDDPDFEQRLSRLAGVVGPVALKTLTKLRIAQAGAGRNGSEIASRLGPVVRSYRFFDPDRLGIENLDATIGATRDDVGRPKVDILSDRLTALRGDSILVSPVCKSVADPDVIDLLRDSDVIITATDSDVARAAIALYSQKFQKLHLDVGSIITGEDDELRFAGDVRFFYPGQGCVFCCGGLLDEEDAMYELFAPPGALPRRPPQPWHSHRRGSSSALNAIVCGIAVQILIDAVTGHQRTSTWHRVRWQRGEGLETAHGPVDGSPDCRLCGRHH
jgi:molybdopterin/thiamine biosynthesis adenylyltransferase